ncbi:MAG: 50S ribosomal protein L17 [Patescibacteria group bacterium]
MNHARKNRKFGREKNQRVALMKTLATSLIEREKITTTEAKAKSLRPAVEKLISLGKKGTLASRRLIVSRTNERAARKVSTTLAEKYKGRSGGYTRILKLPRRLGDGSPMAIIELV